MSEQLSIEIRAKAILDEASKQISTLMTEVEKKSDAAGSKVKMSFGDIARVTTVAAGAVAGVAAGITVLGTRGADVLDIKGAFDELNATIGNNSTKVLETLRTQFAGTVTDFDLMKMANASLASGLKATDEDFKLLANGARVLADRTGGSASQAFQTLATAMATGKTKGAELLIGVVDNTRAMEAYAQRLGVTVQDLTEQQKVEAAAIATKQQLRKAVGDASGATADFGDKVEQSKVRLQNFVDDISSWVATSPAIGGWSSAITGVSGAFTVAAAAAGPLKSGVTSLVGLLGKNGLAGSAGTAGMALRSTGVAAGLLGAAAGGWAIGKWIADLRLFGDAAMSIGESFEFTFTKMDNWWRGIKTSDADIETAIVSRRKLQSSTADVGTAMDKAAAAAAREAAALEADTVVTKSAKEAAEKLAKAKDEQAAAYRSFTNWIGEREIEMHAAAIKAKEEEDKRYAAFRNEIGERLMLEDLARYERERVLRSKSFADMAGLYKGPSAKDNDGSTLGVSMGSSILSGLQATFTQHFGSTVMAALTGGGNILQSVGGLLGGSLTKSIFGGKAMQDGIKNIFGATLGGAFNALLPGIGTLIGPLIGKIGSFFDGLFGPNQRELDGRKAAAAFRTELEGMLSPLQRAEAGTEKWKHSVIAVRDAFIAAGRTEREALDIMDRLWKAEKQGGDAVAQVIREIQAVMQSGVTPAVVDTGAAFASAAAAGVTGFGQVSAAAGVAAGEIDLLKAEIAKPIMIKVGWNAEDFNVTDFLKSNPNDQHRAGETGNITDPQMRALMGGAYDDAISSFFAREGRDDLYRRGQSALGLGQVPSKFFEDYIRGKGYTDGGFVNAPMSGMGVTVHGREAIIPMDKPSTVASQMAREIAGALRGAGGQIVVQLMIDGRKAAESIVPHLPRVLASHGLA